MQNLVTQNAKKYNIFKSRLKSRTFGNCTNHKFLSNCFNFYPNSLRPLPAKIPVRILEDNRYLQVSCKMLAGNRPSSSRGETLYMHNKHFRTVAKSDQDNS